MIPGIETWWSLEGELEGLIPPDNSILIIVSFDISALDPGMYDDTLTVFSNDTWVPEKPIPARLEVMSGHTVQVPGDFATIQEAIDYSIDCMTVLVADGTYRGYGNKNLDFRGKALAVLSENGASSTVIDCENNGRGCCFNPDEGADSKLDGFTIKNGTVVSGGGIYCSDYSHPTIMNCIISENHASSGYEEGGGGIYCSVDSHPDITNCIISNNTTDGSHGCNGGGIYLDNACPGSSTA